MRACAKAPAVSRPTSRSTRTSGCCCRPSTTRRAPRNSMRILVAHQVPRARTGGMSRLMAFIHDRLEPAGHEVEYFCADDVPASWAGWWGRRVAFPMAVRARVIAADRDGRPYDIVNVHEASAAPLLIGRRAHAASVVVTSHGLER